MFFFMFLVLDLFKFQYEFIKKQQSILLNVFILRHVSFDFHLFSFILLIGRRVMKCGENMNSVIRRLIYNIFQFFSTRYKSHWQAIERNKRRTFINRWWKKSVVTFPPGRLFGIEKYKSWTDIDCMNLEYFSL